MANILKVYKRVRPKTKILAEDYNGLQEAIISAFNTLGEGLLESAPEGSRGVSTAFTVGTPVTRLDAVNRAYMDDTLVGLGVSQDIITSDRERAEAAAVSAEGSASAAAGYSSNLGVPVTLNDGDAFTVAENASVIEIICLGSATITLPEAPASLATYRISTVKNSALVAISTDGGKNTHTVNLLNGEADTDVLISGIYELRLLWVPTLNYQEVI
jgi:hypothetical protein